MAEGLGYAHVLGVALSQLGLIQVDGPLHLRNVPGGIANLKRAMLISDANGMLRAKCDDVCNFHLASLRLQVIANSSCAAKASRNYHLIVCNYNTASLRLQVRMYPMYQVWGYMGIDTRGCIRSLPHKTWGYKRMHPIPATLDSLLVLPRQKKAKK